MLKQRIITASVLAIITLVAIYLFPPLYFALLTAVAMLLALWEWTTLSNIAIWYERLLVIIAAILLMLAAWFEHHEQIGLQIGVVWWLIALIFTLSYPRLKVCWNKGSFIRALMGLLTIIPCWLALNVLAKTSELSKHYLVFMLFLIWAADVGAYFAGRRWGKDPLAIRLSPKKTWQGLYGGVALAFFVALLGAYLLKIPFHYWAVFLLISLLTVLISVVGDLFESMLKRERGIKDSGSILPGHGGVLDRLDSVAAAAPFFVLAMKLTGFV